MKKKTPAEPQEPEITKTTRTQISLNHSLTADQQINTVLPDSLAEFEEALARGDLKDLRAKLDDLTGAHDRGP